MRNRDRHFDRDFTVIHSYRLHLLQDFLLLHFVFHFHESKAFGATTAEEEEEELEVRI
jgi:hypothetical protein